MHYEHGMIESYQAVSREFWKIRKKLTNVVRFRTVVAAPKEVHPRLASFRWVRVLLELDGWGDPLARS